MVPTLRQALRSMESLLLYLVDASRQIRSPSTVLSFRLDSQVFVENLH